MQYREKETKKKDIERERGRERKKKRGHVVKRFENSTCFHKLNSIFVVVAVAKIMAKYILTYRHVYTYEISYSDDYRRNANCIYFGIYAISIRILRNHEVRSKVYSPRVSTRRESTQTFFNET